MTVQASEYDALRRRCGLLDRPAPPRLVVSGEDRLRFVNGMVTCNVASLEPGRGVYGFFTDAKGRIQADVVVRALEDALWLELPSGMGEPIVGHLQKYVVADRVVIEESSDTVPVTLAGPSTPELLASLGPSPVPEAPWDHGEFQLDGRALRLSADGRFGTAAWSLWVPRSSAEGVAERLRAVDAPLAPIPIGPKVAEIVRVEAGIPRFGQDFGSEHLPQETGQDDAVSYDKGCYLGQEVVARIHYRGQAARLLRRLAVEAPAPQPALSLTLEGRSAGRLTSVVCLPGSGRWLGLAILERRATEPGTRLSIEGGGEAEVLGED